MHTNILFLFTDDQRFDALGAMNNPEISTPNMDRLAENGTMFTHAHIMGSTCGAVCMPSRAMMLTGRTLFRLVKEGHMPPPIATRTWEEIPGRVIPPEHPSMPEVLRGAGYTTFHTGKWHQDRKSHARCFSAGAKLYGFKKGWYETCDGHWHLPVHDFDPKGIYDPDDGYYEDAPIKPFDPPFTKTKEKGRHSSEVISDAAIRFLRDYKDDAPFFMYVAYPAPHDPRQSPIRFWDMYDVDKIALPENFMPEHPFDNGELRIRDELLEAWPRTPEAIRQHIADYYAIISHLDDQIGRVLRTLEETGSMDSTIIVFAGDNGLAVGQHGLMGKQNLYDHSVRVPLIMCGPGVPRGQRSAAYCYLLDIFPTLCELTGCGVPDTVEGKSLVPAFLDSSVRIRDRLHCAYKSEQRSVRDRRYKLIEYVVRNNRTTQLFDLQEDPRETKNLADESLHEDRLLELRRELLRWEEELGDTMEEGENFWRGFRT